MPSRNPVLLLCGVRRRWRWCAGPLVFAAMVLAGSWLTAGQQQRVARPGGLDALSRLPVLAQSVISTTVGAGNARFAPRRRAGEFGLYGGGVALSLGRAGVSARAGEGWLSVGLSAVGRAARLRHVTAVSPRVRSDRVVYARGSGVREWYAAGPLGVEQGFALTRRLAGGSGAVTLALALRGGLRARLSGSGIEFLAPSGRVGLRYGGLVALDARGRRLATWLSLSGSRLLLRVADRGARYPLRVDPLIQRGPKLTGGGESGPGRFGFSVTLSGDGGTALIGGQGDNGGVGAAWMFVRSGSTWTQQGPKLTATDENDADGFGFSVALSKDGDTALIGGPFDKSGVGAAWVFVRSGGTWAQEGLRLTASDESGAGLFGWSVALSGNGNTALIGGPEDNSLVGAAWVFARSGATWTQQGSNVTATDETGQGQFGWSVALSGNGNTALIGGPDDNDVGAAWIFACLESTWTQQGSKLTANDETGQSQFGWSVALPGDGNTALIGGPEDNNLVGAAWVFVRAGSTSTQQGSKLTGSGGSGTGRLGWSVALSGDGSIALLGGPIDNGFVGAAWAFVRAVPAAITSPPGATFMVGRGGSFTVTAGGRPTPSLSESGALPAGVGFVNNGNGTATLVGTPAAGTGGTYHLTITAGNAVSPDATQGFELIVEAPPNLQIRTPVAGASYTRGQVIASSLGCSEGPGGPGIVSCTDQRGRPSGAPLDTSAPGAHAFTATARSSDGLSASKTVSYTVLLAARVRVSAIHASPLRRGCIVEIGRDKREIAKSRADATCRHVRLALHGTIQADRHLASAAGGVITVSFKVKLPRGLASGTARTTVNHGHWHIALVLPAVDRDPLPPSYLITVHYKGDDNTHEAITSRRVRLESERPRLNP